MNTLSVFEYEQNTIKELFLPFQINCEACSGLCCVALFFSKTDGFPADKPGGKPCTNLLPDFRCSIHSRLQQENMKGCLSYDCMGAGQIITKNFNWKKADALKREQIFEAFLNTFRLQQILFYLTQALILNKTENLKIKLSQHITLGKSLYTKNIDSILHMDLESYQIQANLLLKEILNKLSYGKTKDTPKKIDYMGKNLSKKNLTGSDFSMTYLIAANLEGSNLYEANFLGADMRDANIRNTDLSNSIFLTQSQINSAIGNKHTKLPVFLSMPLSWK